MIRNYFIVAFRNAMRNKLFSFVNIAGLSLGLAISFLVLIHVRQELSYEKHLPHYELIYRVASKYWAKLSPPMAAALKAEIPEVTRIGRLYYLNPAIVEFGDAQTFSNYTYHADTSIPDVFGFELVKGNPKTALSDPSAIVLTEALAGKLFKEGVDPIGKEVVLDGYLHYTVSGIMKDQPATTHLKIDCLLSMVKSNAYSSDSRTWNAVSTYVRFDSQEEAGKVAGKLRQFQYRYREGIQTKEEIDRTGDYFELHPITDIHLNSHREKETEANSNMIYIYIFSAFGILIIFIASINFINLFTAQAIKRIKEIGIRKAIGAQRPQLIAQFLGESFLTVCVSGILALGLAYLVFPWYNQIAAVKLNPDELFSMNNLSAMLTLVFATGVLAGGYPAYMISRSSAVDSFKNSSTPLGKKSFVRRMLVGAQFAVSLFLLMATFVVYSQMELIHTKGLGYNKEEVIGIKLYGRLWVHATQHNEALRNELLKSPDVKEITLTDRLMGERFGWESFGLTDRPDDEAINARFLRVSDGFLETMEIELIQGSGFERSTDSIPKVILNETAAKLLHTKELIGKEYVNRAQNGDRGRIVGIAKDFNFASLHAVIDPLIIEKRVQYPDNLVIRINGSRSREALAHIESVLKTSVPGTSVFYSFIDEKLRALYGKEEGLYYTVQIFSLVTMIIACLGLFALAANTAEARTKEIGIRKVMGASVRSILVLLCSDYMKLIFFAMAVAVPVVIYFGSEWLMGFAYKIEMGWWMFALPALVVIALAMLAIGGQSVRVAKANPAKSLKHE